MQALDWNCPSKYNWKTNDNNLWSVDLHRKIFKINSINKECANSANHRLAVAYISLFSASVKGFRFRILKCNQLNDELNLLQIIKCFNFIMQWFKTFFLDYCRVKLFEMWLLVYKVFFNISEENNGKNSNFVFVWIWGYKAQGFARIFKNFHKNCLNCIEIVSLNCFQLSVSQSYSWLRRHQPK